MTDFQALFTQSRGEPIQHNGQTLHMADRFPVSNGQALRLTFDATSSDWRQGVHLSTVGSFNVAGQVIKSALVLWRDTAPDAVDFTVQSKSGFCSVKNVWDIGDGVMHSWHNGGAMIVSDYGSERLYECNDGYPDDDFDDLVFRIRLGELTA